MSPFRGQTAALGTLHEKERAIAPPLCRQLGLTVVVAGIDTDRLGTFSGEVERTGSPRETVLRKARWAAETAGTALGLASEGSFGPHPALPWLPCGEELIAIIDRNSGWELVVRRRSLRTTHGQATGRAAEDVAAVLTRFRFPTHAVIVRPNGGTGPVRKGITDPALLAAAMAEASSISPDGLARVESDMRAHMNPTRMAEIRRLAVVLGRRLAAPCPACGAPGFGVEEPVPGLPCGWCGTPTDAPLGDGWLCAQCGHVEIHPRRNRPATADPGQCPSCNP